ncbi:MAG: hypothetical protein IID35_08375 [Planctomycetes bacterium]|nr:hypothetical protein [Planctomycetota bacterium]
MKPKNHTPSAEELPPSLKVVPTIYPASPPLGDDLQQFWQTGPEFDTVEVCVEPAEKPLALLEQLGPSPFERGGFPLIGFLATTYDKVSRFALEAGRRRTKS